MNVQYIHIAKHLLAQCKLWKWNFAKSLLWKWNIANPCYAVQQIFFFCLSKGKLPAIKTVNWNEVSCENGILHNHCSDNVEPNPKDNSKFALHFSLLRGSTDFFFCLSNRKHPAIKTVNWNEVGCENGILHNHCSYNVEPISKDNCEFALRCSLLRMWFNRFFFCLPKGKRPANCQLEQSKW